MKGNFINKYHLVDARNLLSIIPKNVVDVTITSPPYGNLKNYEKGIPEDMKVNQIGFRQKYQDYLNDIQSIFKDVFDVTKESGSLWIVIDTFSDNGKIRLLPFDLVRKLEEIGWKLKDIIIWDKTPKNLPWSRKGQFRKMFEYILFFVKTKNFEFNIERVKDPNGLKEWWKKYPERYNPQGKTPTNIWNFEIPLQGSWGNGYLRHFCPFPPKLVERILLLTTNKNQVVLDVFGGSGIVLGIAKVMGRKFIGFDINEHYIKNFHNKVLPQIEKNWEERRIELNLLVKQRSKKKDEIKKLRQVKYPKTLLNEILKLRNERTLENFPLYTIFSISKYLNEMKQDIFLVFDGEINFEKLNKDVKTIIKKPPLSKFGINVNVSAFKKDDFIQKNKNNTLFNGSSLYLYTNGITNIPKKSINFSNWVNNFKEDWLNQRYPPIISNIKVNIRVKNKK